MRFCALILVVASACARLPQPPGQPATGPGGATYLPHEVVLRTVGQGPSEVRVYEPSSLPAAPLPLVVFLHGYQALGEGYYQAWLNHLTLHQGPGAPDGAVVVLPIYQERWSVPGEFTDNAASAIQAALDDLKQRGTQIDLERVIFVGHSGGSALAVNLAARAPEDRAPVHPKALVLTAPGRCIVCNQLSDPGIPLEPLYKVPSTLLVAVVNSQDDEAVGGVLGQRFFEGLTQIPRSKRTYLELPSDDFGGPALRANHRAPAANPESRDPDWSTDALDFYGTWKITDAMMGCAFAGEDCDIALGEGAAQKSMGVWSDGTPVIPMRGWDDR